MFITLIKNHSTLDNWKKNFFDISFQHHHRQLFAIVIIG